jgi:hypothetical protein
MPSQINTSFGEGHIHQQETLSSQSKSERVPALGPFGAALYFFRLKFDKHALILVNSASLVNNLGSFLSLPFDLERVWLLDS